MRKCVLSRRQVALSAGLLALGLLACGDPPAPPPTVDVTGTWTGVVDSVDDTGGPVYGAIRLTLVLEQAGATVTGTYASDVAPTPIQVGGGVAANVVTLVVPTSECRGELHYRGAVTVDAAAAVMALSGTGTTVCAGGVYLRGTLTRQ